MDNTSKEVITRNIEAIHLLSTLIFKDDSRNRLSSSRFGVWDLQTLGPSDYWTVTTPTLTFGLCEIKRSHVYDIPSRLHFTM
jgi:hypothetical protein